MMVPHRLRVLLLPLACSLCFGCGENWEVKTYPASGRVTINGQPPAGALVQLQPIGQKTDERDSRPWGLVRNDGTYTLSTYEKGDGSPPGEYAFTITWPVDPSVPSLSDRLGYRYSRPDQSPWKITIKESDNNIPPVTMNDVEVDEEPGSASAGSMSGPVMPGVPRKDENESR